MTSKPAQQGKTTTLAGLLLAGMLLSARSAAADAANATLSVQVAAGELADAVETIAAEAGLQVVYDYSAIAGLQSPAIAGSMPLAEALDGALAGTRVSWDLVDEDTIVLRVARERGPAARESAAGRREPADRATGLGDIEVIGDAGGSLPQLESDSAFGFRKSVMATPRSVSVIGAETMDAFALSAVEDLVRVAPGVYTTTRWGIQGSVDVRNVPADTYFRGMKRLDLQGHGRSVLAAMESIEIVRGPPSPIYGMGKIGGYTNMIPKSVRAATGGYLLAPQGFVQTIVGTERRGELSFGVGGPLSLAGKDGGYYVYGLVEDSGSPIEHVPIDQKVLQAAINVDDFVGRFRLETGVNLQRSMTAGALVSRLTQDLVDADRYIRGEPLVDLDANGNGRIGYLEMFAGSPIQGAVTAANRPLRQYFDWPVDGDGRPLPLGAFPTVPGIPAALYDYLTANPAADPSGLLRAAGPGGPLPESGRLPVGFALDPRTVAFDDFREERPGAYERELEADYAIAYLDLINDSNPTATIKNQLFFDSMDQYKLSEQPFSQVQDVYVIEDKLTATRQLTHARQGLDVELLASFNLRYTSSSGRVASGDYGSHRTDANSGDGLPGPNEIFATALQDSDLADDGYPWTSHYDSSSLESGVGLLFDITVGGRTNILVGGRVDRSHATNVDFAGTLDLTAGTQAAPAAFTTTDERASGRDWGRSFSLSLSHEFAGRVRPYLTVASTSLALDGNNNSYDNRVIEAGHIGLARLTEVGVKGRLLDGKLAFSAAGYEQARDDVGPGDEPAVINAHASATTTRGAEAELSVAPVERLLLSFYALHQTTRYTPNMGATLLVDTRALGFEDIVDASGRVVYPAEAFGYGGRTYLVLPPGVDAYERKRGNPETQIGATLQVALPHRLGLSLSANYFSSVDAGRLGLVRLPSAYVLNAGLFWSHRNLDLRGEFLNVLDERYFRARTGDTLGDVLASVMPGRRFQITLRVRL